MRMVEIMSDQRQGTPGEEDREAQAGWQDTGPHAADGRGTAVAEAPPETQHSSRTLGPGSLGGTVCADPEMRFSQYGKAIVKVRLAVAPRVKDEATGNWFDGKTEFIDVTVFGKQGENVMESLRKGDRVLVNGIWQESRWRSRDGEWKSSKSLTARDIGPSLLFRQATPNRFKGEN